MLKCCLVWVYMCYPENTYTFGHRNIWTFVYAGEFG